MHPKVKALLVHIQQYYKMTPISQGIAGDSFVLYHEGRAMLSIAYNEKTDSFICMTMIKTTYASFDFDDFTGFMLKYDDLCVDAEKKSKQKVFPKEEFAKLISTFNDTGSIT